MKSLTQFGKRGAVVKSFIETATAFGTSSSKVPNKVQYNFPCAYRICRHGPLANFQLRLDKELKEWASAMCSLRECKPPEIVFYEYMLLVLKVSSFKVSTICHVSISCFWNILIPYQRYTRTYSMDRRNSRPSSFPKCSHILISNVLKFRKQQLPK